MLRVRSNNEGMGGLGKGDERNTAASIERITASSPLQRPMRTSTMSPLGICVTRTSHSKPR